MPIVNGKHFSYSKKGKKAARKAMKKKKRKNMDEIHMMR